MAVKITLKGGPFDGQTLSATGALPQYIVPVMHPDRPVYCCTVCQCCAAEESELDYVFKGYDRLCENITEIKWSSHEKSRTDHH